MSNVYSNLQLDGLRQRQTYTKTQTEVYRGNQICAMNGQNNRQKQRRERPGKRSI